MYGLGKLRAILRSWEVSSGQLPTARMSKRYMIECAFVLTHILAQRGFIVPLYSQLQSNVHATT